MKNTLQAALLSGAIGIAVLASTPHAFAAFGITLDFGDVDVAYRDGYWDHSHHWHHWNNDNDWQRFRHDHGDRYHDWKHDDRGHDHDH